MCICSNYIYDNTCVTQCPKYNKVDNDNINCKACSKDEYYYNGNCLIECPVLTTYLIDENNKNECIKCNKNYTFNNECLDEYPFVTIILKDSSKCAECETGKIALDYLSCEFTCPYNSITLNYLDKKICSSCNTSIIYNNKCLDECPLGTYLNITKNSCIIGCIQLKI